MQGVKFIMGAMDIERQHQCGFIAAVLVGNTGAVTRHYKHSTQIIVLGQTSARLAAFSNAW